jgi:hypothetical protein
MAGDGFAASNRAVVVHLQEHGRYLEQRVGLAIEAAGFQVNDDRQEAPEAAADGGGDWLPGVPGSGIGRGSRHFAICFSSSA